MKYDVARQALFDARTLDDVKNISDQAEALEKYARQIHDTDMELWLAEIKIRAKRAIGEMSKQILSRQGFRTDKVTSSGAGRSLSKEETLSNAGLTTSIANRCEKIADIPEDKFEKVITGAKESKIPVTYADIESAVTKNVHVSNNSGVNEWYTPKEYLDLARAVMGGIDLDPASSDAAQKVVQADKYFTAENSGLDHEWEGRVWMNPPYSSALVKEFSRKICHSAKVTEAMILVNNATETDWFQAMIARAEAVLFPSKRIKFIDVDGNPGGAPLQGQALIYCGKNKDKFVHLSKKYGTVMCVESALSHYGMKMGTSMGRGGGYPPNQHCNLLLRKTIN